MSYSKRHVWLMAMLLLAAGGTALGQPTLSSDKPDYAPGEIALLTGTNFGAEEWVWVDIDILDPVTLEVLFPNYDWRDGPTDAAGWFQVDYTVPEEAAGLLLRARATGETSGLVAETTFTDGGQACGAASISSVVGVGGACVVSTIAGQNQFWDIAEGGTYTITLSGVTECSGDSIEVIVHSSASGNYCTTATGANGTYTFTFPAPANACNTDTIEYCTSNCQPGTGIFAKDSLGGCMGHLRFAYFDAGCIKTGNDTDCAPTTGACCKDCGDLDHTYGQCVAGLTQEECTAQGGQYQGDGTTCPCSDPCPVQDCSIQCGGNITRTCVCGGESVVVTWPDPIVTNGTFVGCEPPSGSSFPIGTTTVLCMGMDPYGVECMCSFNVIVQEDMAPPTITCADDATIECSATPVFPAPTVLDLCDPNPVVTFNDATTPGECPQEYCVTRTWTATDACGNAASCDQMICVMDNTPPTITCANDTSIECPATPVFPAPTVLDLCDPNPVVTFVDVTTPGSCPQEYCVTRTWTATDACGNAASCDQMICVMDNTPPTITCPPDVTLVGCEDCQTNPDAGEATAIDNCTPDADIVILSSDSVVGDCPKVITRTWTATDNCGNSSTCTQTITCVPAGLMTNTERCVFDCNAQDQCQSFRLLFTPDPQSLTCYKLTATNPGQYYYNVFFEGTPGESKTFTVSLPYPFVTQGAQPIHAYDGVTVDVGNGGDSTCPTTACLTPLGEFFVDSTQVTLGSYSPQAFGSTATLTETVTVPENGFVFLTIHLDYGLKGTRDYLNKDSGGNATLDAWNCASTTILIPNGQSYAFSEALTGSTASLCSFNVFKKNPGAGGLDLYSVNLDPVPGATMKLKKASGQVVGTGLSDEDGWYMIQYKHTGKPATYIVTFTKDGNTLSQQITLQANKFVEVNFLYAPPGGGQ